MTYADFVRGHLRLIQWERSRLSLGPPCPNEHNVKRAHELGNAWNVACSCSWNGDASYAAALNGRRHIFQWTLAYCHTWDNACMYTRTLLPEVNRTCPNGRQLTALVGVVSHLARSLKGVISCFFQRARCNGGLRRSKSASAQ